MMNITNEEMIGLTDGGLLLVKLLACEEDKDARRLLATLTSEQLRNMATDAAWSVSLIEAEVTRRTQAPLNR